MTGFLLICASALWLGVLTSISPCPLATNVAAVTLLSRHVGARRRALAGVIVYTIGRTFVYVALAMLIGAGLASMPHLSRFLTNDIIPYVGPILILSGIAVLGVISLPIDFHAGSPEFAKRLMQMGLLGETALGMLFALSFCPVSAALFFGSLLPLALPSAIPQLVVFIYGLGTALPVGIIAVMVILSAERVSTILAHIAIVQKWAARVTGVVLIVIGGYMTIVNTILQY